MRDKCQIEKQLYIYEVAKTIWRLEQKKKLKNKSFGLLRVQKLITFLPRTAHSRDVGGKFNGQRNHSQLTDKKKQLWQK